MTWVKESKRHSLASRGIKTAQKIPRPTVHKNPKPAFIVVRKRNPEGKSSYGKKHKILVRYNSRDIEPLTEIPQEIRELFKRESERARKSKYQTGLGTPLTVSFKYLTPDQALTIIGLVKGKRASVFPNTRGHTTWWNLK